MQQYFLKSYVLNSQSTHLFGVELDNELFLHRQSKVFANWEAFDFTFELLLFNGDPLWQSPSNHRIQRINDGLDLSAFFRHFYRVADINQVGRNVDPFSVDHKVVMPDEMAALCSGIGEAKTIYDVIQTAFEKDQQVRAGDTLFSVGFFEKEPELLFGKAIRVLDFLFLTKLNAVVGGFASTPLPMLSGGVASPIKCAFIRIAAVSL